MSLASRSRRLLVTGTAAMLLAAGLPAIASAPAAADEPARDYTALVNPFVSTEDDFGQDLVGAEAPGSIVKINPMTVPDRSHSGYDYAEDEIAGFTHTNLNGVGGSGAGGDLLVVPTYETYTGRPNAGTYAKGFSHDAEEATPGYYSVDLETDGGAIRAEATTDVRTGQDRFTFPQAGAASLVVDLRNNFTDRRGASLEAETLDDGRVALSGDVTGHFNGYDYTLHYYVESTEPVAGVRTWGGDGALSAEPTREGADIGAVIDLDVAAEQQVGLRMAVSPISVEQAKTDLAVEMGDRSFDAVRSDTKAAWNELLGRIDVTASETSDPDGELQTLFYTHLYRMFGSPMNATSTSGTYRGLDGEVHTADGYVHYDGWGFWDDFRKYEILAIGYPEVFRDMAQSTVDLYATFASTGKGSLSNVTHSVPTVRFERAAVVIADAVAKGAQLRGLAQAWPALVSQSQGGYADEANERRGYIANEVDDTLGTAYDDWAMATIADSLGRTEEAEAYRLRAANWTHLYKSDAVTLADGEKSGLIFPKDANGSWVDADPERFEDGNVYQGTLWQYHWYAANDMGGLIDKMGGEERARDALSFMFGEHAPDDGTRMLHANANEIDLQAPYLFNYVGAPAKTQHWVRSIYTKETWNRYIATGSTHEAPSGGGEFTPPVKTKVFKNSPQGFLPTMDNDTGTMSSTFVAAALGLFPVAAGSDEYQIGTPFFENVSIQYPTGRTFNISAEGVSPDAYYIQSASLNGDDFERTWLTYDQLTAGGDIT
ncbi:MAG: glycoside hydrolase domain-containing protein, partial [Candidatus Microbacterium stercoravium]